MGRTGEEHLKAVGTALTCRRVKEHKAGQRDGPARAVVGLRMGTGWVGSLRLSFSLCSVGSH